MHDISLTLPSSSQWYITFRETPHLDKKHTVFGKLVGGEDVLDALEAVPVKPGTERPAKPVRITEVIMYAHRSPVYLLVSHLSSSHRYQDPFEEYKTRQQKKRAKKAEAEENARTGRVVDAQVKKDGDDINWFGVKVGLDKSNVGSGGGGGVGKYLNAGSAPPAPKRPAVAVSVVDASEAAKKKRKIGFGSFEGW